MVLLWFLPAVWHLCRWELNSHPPFLSLLSGSDLKSWDVTERGNPVWRWVQRGLVLGRFSLRCSQLSAQHVLLYVKKLREWVRNPGQEVGTTGIDDEGICTAPAKKDHIWRSAATRDALRKALSHLTGASVPPTKWKADYYQPSRSDCWPQRRSGLPYQGVDLSPIQFYTWGKVRPREEKEKIYYKCITPYILVQNILLYMLFLLTGKSIEVQIKPPVCLTQSSKFFQHNLPFSLHRAHPNMERRQSWKSN